MSYLEWNIDDADRDYVFEEVKSYDMIEMINLNIRGTTSHYTLPTDAGAGRMVTIKNRDFGYAEEGAYFGVEIILADNTEENSSYYFFFKNQTVSFFFNGTRWFLKDPWPFFGAKISFIRNNTIQEGYLDIKEYQDDVKKILFSNISFGDFDPSTIEGRFFRDGEFGVTQEDTFQQHTHYFKDHTHSFFHVKDKDKMPITKKTNNGIYDSEPCFKNSEDDIFTDYCDEIETREEGIEETRPKNIQGSYILKCW